MHITFSTGDIAVIVAIIGGLLRVETYIWQVQKLFAAYGIEHEILIQDYVDRKGIKLYDLPTRTRNYRR